MPRDIRFSADGRLCMVWEDGQPLHCPTVHEREVLPLGKDRTAEEMAQLPSAPMISPVIHPNGDRKDTLLRNLQDAYRAVSQAITALRECAPNGRNCYPAPGRMEAAIAQYKRRQTLLEEVRASLAEEAKMIEKLYPG